MTITLDIPYNKTYSSKISFETTINEKITGFEQRYPQKIYPVRHFTLNFNKNQYDREQLEAFFASVLGQGNTFQWTWSSEYGGNGKTYTCRLDMDELKETITYMGYGEDTNLSFYAIDYNEYTPPTDFSSYYKEASYDAMTRFNTLVDSTITASNSARSLWTRPLKIWELQFEKTKENREALEAFFISKHGKFKAFDWDWETDKGGDGQTYKVRFNSDDLDWSMLEEGYGTVKIQIKEVDTTVTTDPYAEDEIIPRILFELVLDTGSVYILQNDTMQTLTYSGKDFIGAPLEIEDIKTEDTTEVVKVGVTVSNVNQAFSAIIGDYNDPITGTEVNVYEVFLNTSTYEIVSGMDTIILKGKANNIELTLQDCKFNVEINMGGYEQSVPKLTYGTNCQWMKFKDNYCKYAGSATSCDFTLSTCKRLGNVENFGGCPAVAAESIIKA